MAQCVKVQSSPVEQSQPKFCGSNPKRTCFHKFTIFLKWLLFVPLLVLWVGFVGHYGSNGNLSQSRLVPLCDIAFIETRGGSTRRGVLGSKCSIVKCQIVILMSICVMRIHHHICVLHQLVRGAETRYFVCAF